MTILAVLTNSSGLTKLRMTPRTNEGDEHTGTFFLGLSEVGGRRYLEGEYITNRILADGRRGACGFIKLVWVSSKLKKTLAYSYGGWPTEKPPQPPEIAAGAT